MTEVAAWNELFAAAEASWTPSLPAAATPASTAPAAEPTLMKLRLVRSVMRYPFKTRKESINTHFSQSEPGDFGIGVLDHYLHIIQLIRSGT
jgi:hypothetical protein